MTAAKAPQIARILREKLGDEIDYFDTIDKLRTPDVPVRLPGRDIPRWTADKAIQRWPRPSSPASSPRRRTCAPTPAARSAANLLGYVNGDGKGVAGLEQQYDKASSPAPTARAPTRSRRPASASRWPTARVTKMVPGQRRQDHDRPRPAVVRRPAPAPTRCSAVQLRLGPRDHDGRQDLPDRADVAGADVRRRHPHRHGRRQHRLARRAERLRARQRHEDRHDGGAGRPGQDRRRHPDRGAVEHDDRQASASATTGSTARSS